MSQEKVFQVRNNSNVQFWEVSQEDQEKLVNICGWEGRVLFTKPVAPAVTVDTPEFSALAARYGTSKAGKDYMALVAAADAHAAAVAAAAHHAGRLEAHELHKRVTFKAMSQRDDALSVRACEQQYLKAALAEIAKPIDGKAIGNPWDFYEDMRRYAAEALGVEYVRQDHAPQQHAQAALSDEQIMRLNREAQDQAVSGVHPALYLARAILAASQQQAAAPTDSHANGDYAQHKRIEDAERAGMIEMGTPLQKLGARLTELLDDDQFNNIEPLLNAILAAPAVQVLDERAADADRLCKLLEFCTEAKPQFGPKGDLRAMTMKFKSSVKTSIGYRRELRKLIDEMQSPEAALTKGQK